MTANVLKRKLALRIKRKKRIRAKIFGQANLPRISIFKSNRSIYVQAINDANSTTLVSANGMKLGVKANKEGAARLGKIFAEELKKAGITQGIFDRNAYLYHGVIAAFAQALRENGIKL